MRICDMRICDVRYVNMRYTNVRICDMRCANMRYAICDMRICDMRVANMRYANMRYADMRYAIFEYAICDMRIHGRSILTSAAITHFTTNWCHGLNRHYYSLNIDYRKNELEIKLLSNVHAQKWNTSLVAKNFDDHTECNQKTLKSMLSLAEFSFLLQLVQHVFAGPLWIVVVGWKR